MSYQSGPGVAVVVAVAALIVAGCGNQAPVEEPQPTREATPEPTRSEPPALPDPVHHELTLEWSSQERQYRLDEPDGYDREEPIPLVVVLHGGQGTGASIRIASDLKFLAQEHAVLVAYPYADNGIWRVNPDSDSVDDVGFLTAMVDHLIEEWNVDPGRVYAAGWSNGAEMSYRLAVEASDVFAAVAPVSGNFAAAPDSVDPVEPVSVVGIVGLDDTTVAEAGSLDLWRDLLDCEADEPVVVDGADHATRTDAICADGSEVVEYRIDGVGHTWPDRESHGFDTNEALWEFFTAHARSG